MSDRTLIMEILLLILKEIRKSNEDLDEDNKRLMQEIKAEVDKWPDNSEKNSQLPNDT